MEVRATPTAVFIHCLYLAPFPPSTRGTVAILTYAAQLSPEQVWTQSLRGHQVAPQMLKSPGEVPWRRVQAKMK